MMRTLFCPHRELEGVSDSEALHLGFCAGGDCLWRGVVWCGDGDVA